MTNVIVAAFSDKPMKNYSAVTFSSLESLSCP